jgi:hypothetical protein
MKLEGDAAELVRELLQEQGEGLERIQEALEETAIQSQQAALPNRLEHWKTAGQAVKAFGRALDGDPSGYVEFKGLCRARPNLRARVHAVLRFEPDPRQFLELLRRERDAILVADDFLCVARVNRETGELTRVKPIRRNQSKAAAWRRVIEFLLGRGERTTRIAQALAPLAAVSEERVRGRIAEVKQGTGQA